MCRKYVTMCVIPQMVLVYWLWTPRACMMASSRPAHKAGESKIIIYLPIDSNAGWLVLSFSSISKQQHQCSLCMSPVTTSSCIFGLCLMNWLKVEQWYAPPNPDCSILARKIECDLGEVIHVISQKVWKARGPYNHGNALSEGFHRTIPSTQVNNECSN